ncbi:hypothetical protein PG990_006894 [Apiospora arundinis]
MDSPSSETKARLQRVADLMLEIYQTRAEMRYIDAAAIKRGPHDITHLLPLYQSLELDPAVIYLYSILPYVDQDEAGKREFYMDGTWFNHLDKAQVRESRDPFCLNSESDDDDEAGPSKGAYMRPWYTQLSVLSGCGQVILYDAKEDLIWMFQQGSWQNADPGLPSPSPAENANDWVDEDDDDEMMTDGEDVPVPLAMSDIPARRAADVLRDINTWFRTHQVPFDATPDWADGDRFDPPTRAELYARHGWPDRFDGDAFEVGLLRRWAAGYIQDIYDDLENVLESAQESVDYSRERVAHHQKRMLKAQTTKARWMAQFNVFKASLTLESAELELEHEREKIARRDKELPADSIPVGEYRLLRRRLQKLQSPLGIGKEAVAIDHDTTSRLQAEFRCREREARMLEKAVDAAKAEAERRYPGQDITSLASAPDPIVADNGWDDAWGRKILAVTEQQAKTWKDWKATVPENMKEVRRLVDEEIALAERNSEELREQEMS